MKRLLFFFGMIAAIIAVSAGCIKKEKYPDTPLISMISYTSVFGTGAYAVEGIITISYQDGNGDIGLREDEKQSPFDTGSPYYYNLVISYYEKQKGVFTRIEPYFPISARIPPLTEGFANEPIKGTITDTIPLNPKPVYDTVRFELFIYDRALHKSNVVTTPDIILRKP